MTAALNPIIPSETLLMAYRSGIFPMADARDDPDVFWVEPRERAIIPLHQFHCSRSLRKILRKNSFHVTINTAFDDVVAMCAAPRSEADGSWISHRIAKSYSRLHELGHAHSIECWQNGTLSGGLYGVSFDRVFCGESMFSHADNASKVALAWLVTCMKEARYRLLDCQFMTDHLASLGAQAISQDIYLDLMRRALGKPTMTLPQSYDSLCETAAARGSSPGNVIAQSFTQTS